MRSKIGVVWMLSASALVLAGCGGDDAVVTDSSYPDTGVDATDGGDKRVVARPVVALLDPPAAIAHGWLGRANNREPVPYAVTGRQIVNLHHLILPRLQHHALSCSDDGAQLRASVR